MSSKSRASGLGEIRTKPSVEAGIVHLSEHPGRKVVEYQPGNGTRYVLALMHLGDVEHARRMTGSIPDSWVVADCLGDRRTIIVDVDSYLAPHYFAQKTGFGLVDSVALCELLARLIGCQAMTAEEYVEHYGD